MVIGYLFVKRSLGSKVILRFSLKMGFFHPYDVSGDLSNPDSKDLFLFNLLRKMSVPEPAKIFLCDTSITGGEDAKPFLS